MKRALVNTALILLGACVGFAIGVSLRKTRADHAAAPLIQAAVTNAPADGAPRPGGFRANDNSPLATKLEHDLTISKGVTRWLCWLDAIEKAAPSDFPRLARMAKDNPAALRFVAARWVQIAPRHLFETLLTAGASGNGLPVNELAHELFGQWPKDDPEAAIAALNEPQALALRQRWGSYVVSTVLTADVEQGLQLAKDWHIENYGPRMNNVAKWADADPRHAAEFALANSAGYAAQLTMETIGKEWAKTDPSGALEFAAARPGTLGSMLGAAALKQWAGANRNDAADWLADTDARTRNRLSPAFVESWAKQDSAAALAWCQENLSGSSLAQAIAGVLKGAASKDVAAAAALVTSMDPSPARSEGAVSVADQWFPGLSDTKTVKPETVAWLSSLDPDSIRHVLEKVQWQWATSDPKTMKTFLESAGSGSIPDYTDSILARQLARQNPADAMDWATQLPQDRAINAGSAAFATWRDSQPDTAMKWLNDLASNDPRRQPYFESAIQELAYHPQAAEQLAAMTSADRNAARTVLQAMTSLPDDRRAMLLAALGKSN